MINVFLAYCGKDKMIFDAILENLESLTNYCNFLYYKPIEILSKVNIFIVFISHNSLDSANVQEEMLRAIHLTENEDIKEICPISIDISINPDLDNRIPEYIKRCIYYATSPKMASQIVEERIKKYIVNNRCIMKAP